MDAGVCFAGGGGCAVDAVGGSVAASHGGSHSRGFGDTSAHGVAVALDTWFFPNHCFFGIGGGAAACHPVVDARPSLVLADATYCFCSIFTIGALCGEGLCRSGATDSP